MIKRLILSHLIIALYFLVVPSVFANGLPDADHDAVPDQDELQIYFTDPNNADTDGDSYSDFEEINTGFSPHNPQAVKLIDSDMDEDGLSDAWEIKFRTNPMRADSDGDGFNDGEEVEAGFDPAQIDGKKLDISLRISLNEQKMDYLLNGFTWKSFPVSTGRASMPTPKGEFKILNKIEKAWSKTYGLWMPYWLGLNSPGIGIHELPIWPSGYREGENHLGIPVSHGCIRLGLNSAAYVYEHVSVGTKIIIE
ncbi:L,D-transpeptidase family protein [Patescibacteria group bacterium]|nr:L,D-transpeptidase family protein [Patescibacteria group bacterium]